MIPFRPVIEPNSAGAFLAENPEDIIKSGRSAQVPWITGINTEDGTLRAACKLQLPPQLPFNYTFKCSHFRKCPSAGRTQR